MRMRHLMAALACGCAAWALPAQATTQVSTQGFDGLSAPGSFGSAGRVIAPVNGPLFTLAWLEPVDGVQIKGSAADGYLELNGLDQVRISLQVTQALSTLYISFLATGMSGTFNNGAGWARGTSFQVDQSFNASQDGLTVVGRVLGSGDDLNPGSTGGQAGMRLTYTFSNVSAGSYTFDVQHTQNSGLMGLDDAVVTATAVPEPDTLLLLGSGLGVLGWAQRRRVTRSQRL